jgi:uncharacterized protein (DUF2164 family)
MDKGNRNSGITLSGEEKKRMLDDIIYYFETERDEKLGIIASESILDFFMDILGNSIYNKALDDIKLWYGRRMEDVEADYYTLYKS